MMAAEHQFPDPCNLRHYHPPSTGIYKVYAHRIPVVHRSLYLLAQGAAPVSALQKTHTETPGGTDGALYTVTVSNSSTLSATNGP